MAHNLSSHIDEHGVTRHSSFSLRENPWHRLGQVVEQPVGSADAIKLAGLDWNVELRGLYTADMDAVPHHRAAVRSDNKATLGVVAEQFTPVQNVEVFNWFDSLSGSGIVYETAGALGAGETVWVLARMPEEIRVGADLTQTYLLIYNGHGGNRPVTIAPTGVRVVCQNTLRLASREIRSNRRRRPLEAGYRIRHTKGVHTALADVAEAYRASRACISATQDAYSHLAQVPLTEAMFSALLARSFSKEVVVENASGRAAAIRKAREEKIRTILASPTCTGSGVNGTAFALLNAVTEYVDHERGTRVRGDQQAAHQRFASAHWGSGAEIKEAAFEAILDLTCA